MSSLFRHDLVTLHVAPTVTLFICGQAATSVYLAASQRRGEYSVRSSAAQPTGLSPPVLLSYVDTDLKVTSSDLFRATYLDYDYDYDILPYYIFAPLSYLLSRIQSYQISSSTSLT